MKNTFLPVVFFLVSASCYGQKNEIGFRTSQMVSPVLTKGFMAGGSYFRQLNNKWSVGAAADFQKDYNYFEHYEKGSGPVSGELLYIKKNKATVSNYDLLARYRAWQNKKGDLTGNIIGGLTWQYYNMKYIAEVLVRDQIVEREMYVQATRGFLMPKAGFDFTWLVTPRFFLRGGMNVRIQTGPPDLFTISYISTTATGTSTARQVYKNGNQAIVEAGCGFRF